MNQRADAAAGRHVVDRAVPTTGSVQLPSGVEKAAYAAQRRESFSLLQSILRCMNSAPQVIGVLEHDAEKPVPHLMRGGNRLSEKTMLRQEAKA
jgi:hypothetical protein